jgi:hypothetical protein
LNRWKLERLTNDSDYLYYFGVVHSYDKNNPMFAAIEQTWREFLAKTGGRKRTMLFEGRFEPVGANRDAIITKGGENALIRFLARRDGVDEFRPEPRRIDEINFLRESGFSDEEIFSFYFVRTLGQWHREVEKTTSQAYLERYFETWHQHYGLSGTLGFKELATEVERIAGEELPIERQNSLGRIISTKVWQSRLNDVGRAVADFRDIFIVQQICRLWGEGCSLFAVYGNAHLARQENALVELLGLTKLPATEVLTNG